MKVEYLLPLAGSWLWSTYGKSLADKVFYAGKEIWDETRWNKSASAYRAKVIRVYDLMQIMGMAQPVPLDNIFTDVYMLDKPTAFGRFDIQYLKQSSADPDKPPQTERVNGLNLVKKKDNLFILGKPGAGKTTFLKYIALQSALQNIDKIPIFVTLKKWADSGLELKLFIAERFDICDFPNALSFVEELLKSGSGIVLFDGLDEVNQLSGQRDQQIRELNNFVEKYDRTQCLVTCRIAASDYSFQPFTYVEIADFTENQIRTFVGKWFHEHAEKRDSFLTEFKKDENIGIRDLARTPLLLTLLCLAFNETLTFPQRRVEIYEEALDALLKKWDSSRSIQRDEVYRNLSLGHKENMLARIAAVTFEKNEYFIPQPELERHIIDYVKNVPPHDKNEATDGEVILKAIEIQHGIFVERAREVYSFSHLTFQEYFTARHIVSSAAQSTLTNLVKVHGADGRWREVFLLTTSMLPDASQFMTIFRRSVDELLEADEKLVSLLSWAHKKSTSVQASHWLVRPSYLFVDLYYPSRNFVLDFAPDRALARALARARAHARAYDRARDRALGNDHGFNLDFALIRALARAFTRARDSGGSRARAFAYGLDPDFELARERANMSGFREIAEEFGIKFLQTYRAKATDWQQFADRLRALLIRYRDIGNEWDLTEKQEARLTNYLEATVLLQDCMELAFMPLDEKEAIQNSLYLPPPSHC